MSWYEIESMKRGFAKLDNNKTMDMASYERLKDAARQMMPGEVKF